MNLSRAIVITTACTVAAASLAGGLLVLRSADSAPDRARRDALRPAASVRGTVWVANEGGDSLTAIDTGSGRVVNTVRGIASPHNVQATADGRSVWAVSGRDSSVIGIDAESRRRSGSAMTGDHPAHVVLDRAGARAFVSNSGDDSVSVIDLAGMRTVATIPVGRFPHGMRISPDGSTLLVANMEGGSVTMVDLRRLRPTATIPVGNGPVQVAFDRAGAAYVSLNGDDAVAKIDLALRRRVSSTPVGDGPAQTFVTPDGARLLVANQGTEQQPSDTLSVFDTSTMDLLGTVRTGSGAHGITTDPDGRLAFVTNMFDDDVAVVDLEQLEVVSRVDVGDMPNGISFSTSRLGSRRRPDVRLDSTAPATNPAGGDHGHVEGMAH